jgi:hypothetical protein
LADDLRGMMDERYLNLTVMPEYPQTEGVGPVLDNLQARARATAVTTSPYVMAPAEGPGASREPPGDTAAGSVRLLDRPLWGRRALMVRTAPSFEADRSLYEGLRYQPPQPDELTARHGPVVEAFLDGAKDRGLETYLQIQAAIPPGYRVQFGGPEPDDQPLLPDGSPSGGRVDNNASLASPQVKAYGCALIRDLCRAYPGVDGIRIDWPEVPPYSFDSLFFDFGPHAQAAAERLGFDFERMRGDSARLYGFLTGGLSDRHLVQALESGEGPLPWLERCPGVHELARFRACLVGELVGAYRDALSAAASPETELFVQGFPPPWQQVSGFDVPRLAGSCQVIGVKLYTMHWPMIVRAYADVLLAANPGLSPALLLRLLFSWLDLIDHDAPERLEEVAYPGPEEPHLAGPGAQARKIEAVRQAAKGTPVVAMAHGYGPLEDVRARLAVAWRASGGKMAVNRYGYLSDDKLAALGEVTNEAVP